MVFITESSKVKIKYNRNYTIHYSMATGNASSVRVANNGRLRVFQEKLLAVLEAKFPLMIKEVAEITGVSPNTAGKYVDILDAKGVVRTDHYATAKRVFPVKGSSGRDGGGP